MKKALLVIDYQNDFVSSDGKVALKLIKILGNDVFKRLQFISTYINKSILIFKKNNNKVIFVKSDYDEKYHLGQFKIFRANGAYGNTALIGTNGHELFNIKIEADFEVLKNYFDAFMNTKLEEYLKGNFITDIYLCGVNTDFCVFHTAITAMIKGYNVFVITDATDTITNNKLIFLEYLEKYMGVKLIQLSDL